VREQAATIQSLNNELTRLNSELGQLLQSRQELINAKMELEEKLQSELGSGNMRVDLQQRGLVVTLLDTILFDSGRAELKDSARETLEKVADVLNEKVKDHYLYVEGHTDNVPIRYSGWKSNWELSASRATEVVHYFIDEKGLMPDRFAAVGYGEFHPVVPNDTEEGKRSNRRVEVVVSPSTYETGN